MNHPTRTLQHTNLASRGVSSVELSSIGIGFVLCAVMVIVALFPRVVVADVIYFKNGNTMVGKVTYQDEQRVMVKRPGGRVQMVARDWIDRIEEADKATELQHYTEWELWGLLGRTSAEGALVEEQLDPIGVYTIGVSRFPDKPSWVGGLAQAYAGKGRDDEAIPLYERAIQLGSENVMHYTGLAEIYVRQGRDEQAIPMYEKVFVLDPYQNVSHYWELAEVFGRLERWDEAIRIAERATALPRSHYFTHFKLGKYYVMVGKLEQAKAAYQEGREAARQVGAHNHADAAEQIARILSDFQPHEVKLFQAQHHVLEGRIDEALSLYEEIVDEQPDNTTAQGVLARLYLQKDQYDRAIPVFRTAITLDPNNAVYHADLAVALAMEGRLDEAIDHGEQAVAIDPTDPVSLQGLGQYLIRRGHIERGKAVLRQAIQTADEAGQQHVVDGVQQLLQILELEQSEEWLQLIELIATARRVQSRPAGPRLPPDDQVIIVEQKIAGDTIAHVLSIGEALDLAGELEAQGQGPLAVPFYETILQTIPDHSIARERLEAMRQ